MLRLGRRSGHAAAGISYWWRGGGVALNIFLGWSFVGWVIARRVEFHGGYRRRCPHTMMIKQKIALIGAMLPASFIWTIVALAGDFKSTTDTQRNVLMNFAKVTELSKRCPVYQVDNHEFAVWSAEEGLSVTDVNSGWAEAFVTGATIEFKKQLDGTTDLAPLCDWAWRKFGARGEIRSNLLHRR